LLSNQRIIFKDGATLRDHSVKLGDYLSGTETLDVVAADDALFIGSDLPFNHRWFEVSSANAAVSAMTIRLWNGSEWKSAVEVIDQTKSTAGATLSTSGIVSWTPDRFQSWAREESTEDISDLSTLKIYDLYWAKITFSVDLTISTALGFIGQRFSSHADVVSEYPELGDANLIASYKTGKTTWDEQAFAAAEYIVRDLQNKQMVWSKNQIIAWEIFRSASVHKTAEIAFRGLGDNYRDNLVEANRAYKAALDVKFPAVDLNANGRLDNSERTAAMGYFTR
jgi:hypothetical protein